MLEYPDWTPLKSQTDHPKISKCEPSFFVNSWHNFYVRKGGGGGGCSLDILIFWDLTILGGVGGGS